MKRRARDTGRWMGYPSKVLTLRGCMVALNTTYDTGKEGVAFFKNSLPGGLETGVKVKKNRINYYPFGATMPGRVYSSGSYSYGFQGQEKDDEVKGAGNSINYKYRMHDPRLGRFFAVDPLAAKYPMDSPYGFSSNQVIHAVELEGLETSNDLRHWPGAQPWKSRSQIEEAGKGSYAKVQFGVFGVVTAGTVAILAGPGVAVKLLKEAVETGAEAVVEKATGVAPPTIINPKDVVGGVKKAIGGGVKEGTEKAVKEVNPYIGKSYEDLLKSQSSYKKLIKEHQEKLDAFKKDPIGNTSPEKLKQMKKDNPTEKVLLERAKGRVPALEKQLTKQKSELKKINEALD